MTTRVWLTRDTLVKCWTTARARDAIKLEHTDRRVSSRPGYEIHFDGLRAEAAFAQLAGQPELVDFSVQMHGDGGTDIRLGSNAVQVKASIYDPPYLRFDIEGSQTFKADVAVLTYLPVLPEKPDQRWVETSGWVDVIGWITREEFTQQCAVMDFGYGPRHIVGAGVMHDVASLIEPPEIFAPGFVGFNAKGMFIHICHCGVWGAFGFGVSVRNDKLGTWYCAEHNPERRTGDVRAKDGTEGVGDACPA